MTAALIPWLLLRCVPRVPEAPSVRSLRLSHDGFAHCFASPPSVPSLRSSHDDVAHCFASLALQAACACCAVGLVASLVTRRRRSWLRLPCFAYRACLWRRRFLRFARHVVALFIASLLLRRRRRVPVEPFVPLLRSSHDGVAHCFALPALHVATPVAPSIPSLRSSHDRTLSCQGPRRPRRP